MKSLVQLKDIKDYADFLNNQPKENELLLLKISSRCTVSFVVQQIFDRWFRGLDKNVLLSCGVLDVITARELSNQIAKDFNIKHESPQAIWLTTEKKVKWADSHHRITIEKLQSLLLS